MEDSDRRRHGGRMTRGSDVIQVVQEGSWYVLLFLLPFSNAVIEVVFGVLLITWLLQRADPATRKETVWIRPTLRPILWGLGAFLISCALSIAVSRYPKLSLQGFVWKWSEYLLFLVIVADVACRGRVIVRSLGVLSGAALLVIVEVVSQEVTGRGLLMRHALSVYDRMTGPYKNPTDLATYLMVIIPILLVFALSLGRWRRRWLMGLMVILLLCLARTESRGAWVGLGVGVACLLAHPGMLRRYAAALAVALVVTAVYCSYRTGHLSTFTSSSEVGNVDRGYMWQAALGMVKAHPVLGLGLNTFMANYLDYWVGGERMPRYAHNCYLQVAAETGLIGLGAFLWFLWHLFGRIIKAIRAAHSTQKLLLVGYCAGLMAFVVQAALDTNFYSLRQAALFWTLSGAAIGLSERTAEAAATPRH